jgi:FtsZ-interacting cell division protein ZipA
MTTINWTDPNVLIVLGLVFLLGLLLGMFMTAGGRRKWKSRYREETLKREQIEREHKRHSEEWAAKEKDWRERDAVRSSSTTTARRDLDQDGVPDSRDRRPADDRRA